MSLLRFLQARWHISRAKRALADCYAYEGLADQSRAFADKHLCRVEALIRQP